MSNLTKADVAQALKHPLRPKLLLVFDEHRPLSPTEASDRLNAPLGTVSYHVRVLVDYGFLILRAKQQVRGATKSYYLPNDDLLNTPHVEEVLDQYRSLKVA